LIELIFVMVILAIGAALVAPHMGSFFRGRVANSEARRMLALVHLAQSRAVAEGVPVLLWIDTKTSTYGLRVQSSYDADDTRASTFTADPLLTLDTGAVETVATSEQDDEKLGLTDGLPVIRFTPDGFYDEISVRKVVFRLGPDDALELGQTANRLGYEIRPYSSAN
jgi:Tfp pilus assembly protein FimT